MVKGKRKPIEEIKDSLTGYHRVLNVGCGGCVSVCLAGGQRETKEVTDELNEAFKTEGAATRVDSWTIERQCNSLFVDAMAERVAEYDCLVSMACGAGVQLLAEQFPNTPVIPGINTIAIGVDRAIGVYEEKCRACGDCVLAYTGGVCPVTRCAKGLFNGPCGGTNRGKCEVSPEVPCAWVDIYERLNAQNRLEHITKIRFAMSWQNQVQRNVVQDAYADRYAAK